MFEWISQLGKKSALFMTKYGAAWLITVYVLSFLNLGMIYLALMLVQIDLVELLKYYEFSGNIIYLAEKGGNIALAYALNRFLAPIRLWIALLLMPFLAPKLNKIWGKISGKDK